MAEALLVILPIAIEVDGAVFAALDDRPTEPVVLELAVDEKGGAAARANGVYSITRQDVFLLPSVDGSIK